MKKRNKNVDTIKGFLIICVVVGHSCEGLIHDFIFLFHMPLFFILSGSLLKRDKLTSRSYLRSRAVALMIPYATYLLLDWLLIRRDFSFRFIAHIIWDGRALSGTYWYITCFIAALYLFSFLLRHFSDRITKWLTILGGSIAVIESHLSERIPLLSSPGVPWNVDVALLAVVYLAIGFYYRERIERWLKEDDKKYDVIALIISILLVVFCVINYCGGRRLYYFDMKPLYYKELISAVVIPCGFGIVLCRNVYWIEIICDRIKVMKLMENGFALLGRMTLPIMFMHVPLNTWKEQFGYADAWNGRGVYVAIGIGVPVIFTVAFSRFRVMRKLFGLPDLAAYKSITGGSQE